MTYSDHSLGNGTGQAKQRILNSVMSNQTEVDNLYAGHVEVELRGPEHGVVLRERVAIPLAVSV